jgi:DNA-binding NarL/FixJ family response regulator
MRQDIARAVAMGRQWRDASSTELADLAAAIQRQFDTWSLTPAEADIAGLMLKGVALRDIAEVRRTSETTIRQQAQGVYRKSGLSGRAQLAAYFLESLFEDREAGTLPSAAE